jgi:hypothetical protein
LASFDNRIHSHRKRGRCRRSAQGGLTVTDPNVFSQTDLLEARELVKTMLPPSFRKAIDAGELDGFGLFKRAEAMLIQRRKDEEAPE